MRIRLKDHVLDRTALLIRSAEVALEQIAEVVEITVDHRGLDGVTVFIEDDIAVLVRHDQTVSGADVHLRLGIHLLLAGDQLDRVAGHDILHDEQNERDAEEDRDEL